jgi:hypothetical protein
MAPFSQVLEPPRIPGRFNPGNRVPVPLGWTELYWQPDTATGFSGGIYRNDQTGEVVVAYTGTNEQRFSDIAFANLPLVIGQPSPQLNLAVSLYRQAIKDFGANPANITFTGHSLGGGLAALMGMFFNKKAVVFDPAPFGLSATSTAVIESVSQLLKMIGVEDPDFEACVIRLFDSVSPNIMEIMRRRQAIEGTYLTGEFLQYLRAVSPAIAGLLPPTPVGSTQLGMFDLHNMTLLGAYKLSTQFAKAAGSLPTLLPAIFDENLFKPKEHCCPVKTRTDSIGC